MFLGLDHNPFPDRDPALFGTIVFAQGEPHRLRRYFIWEEAEAGHLETVTEIRSEMDSAQVEAMKAWETLAARLMREPR
ncbi:hypothetical protein [Acidovorax sp. SDU_ACID1]|uniref:hypothetical protein n=1 Tax=Acidovorax sp. SDU_ACID1 TaxID=3136632 RepID=UPI0038735C88